MRHLRHTELSCDKGRISQAGVLPPVAMQVILTLEPSLYGPSILSGMMVPLSSRIKSFSGGTATNNEYIVIKQLIMWQFFQILTYELIFKNIYHTNLCLLQHTQEYQLVCEKRPIPAVARSKTWICCSFLAGNAGSNPAGRTDVYLDSVVFCQVEVSATS